MEVLGINTSETNFRIQIAYSKLVKELIKTKNYIEIERIYGKLPSYSPLVTESKAIIIWYDLELGDKDKALLLIKEIEQKQAYETKQ